MPFGRAARLGGGPVFRGEETLISRNGKKFFLVLFLFWWSGGVAFSQAVPPLPPPRLDQPPGGSAPGAIPPSPVSGATPSAGGTAGQPVPGRPLPVVSISAELSQPTVPREGTVNLIITLSFEQSATEPSLPLDFEFPNPPFAEGLTLFGNSFRSETELSGNRVEVKRIYTYSFRGEKEGGTEIKPVSINYFWMGSPEKKTISTQSLPVTVTRPAFRLGGFLRHPAVMAVLGVALAAAVAALAWPWFKSRRVSAEKEEKPPAERARERLREADRRRMAGEYAEFLFALSAELGRCLEEGLGIKVRPGSPEKAAEAVAEKLGEEWRERILEFHKLSDKVKFAGYRPETPELDRAMETLKQLVAEVEKAGRCEDDRGGGRG